MSESVRYTFVTHAHDVRKLVTGDWLVQIHPHGSLNLGQEKPEIQPGDILKLTLERITR